jgi:hypothetical protein
VQERCAELNEQRRAYLRRHGLGGGALVGFRHAGVDGGPRSRHRSGVTSLLMRRFWSSAVVFTTLAAMASCGSRTGLFVEPPIDAAIADVVPIVPRDARVDAPVVVDASKDAIEEPVGCIPGNFTFTLATSQLMFVLDRSGSMDFELTSNDPPPVGQPSRWTALRSSLAQTITPFQNEIAMGARFFPSENADGFDPVLACMQDSASASIKPALGNAGAILGVFTSSSPVGGTPSAAALQLAAQEVSSSRGLARAMVIATDGAPNCNAVLDPDTCTCTSASGSCVNNADGTNCLDRTRTVQTITDIFQDRKIPVFVIGIGVTGNFASTLDAMAVAGGRPRPSPPRYYAADTPAELTDAFTAVRDSVSKCSYITPSSPQDPDAITVEIGGQLLTRDPNHLDGWDWIDQAYGHLQLFGSACDLATATNVGGTITCDPPEAGAADAAVDQ